MNPNITRRNELLARQVIKGLESRNMTGYYAADREEAESTGTADTGAQAAEEYYQTENFRSYGA